MRLDMSKQRARSAKIQDGPQLFISDAGFQIVSRLDETAVLHRIEEIRKNPDSQIDGRIFPSTA
jgi:hypothetical protein